MRLVAFGYHCRLMLMVMAIKPVLHFVLKVFAKKDRRKERQDESLALIGNLMAFLTKSGHRSTSSSCIRRLVTVVAYEEIPIGNEDDDEAGDKKTIMKR